MMTNGPSATVGEILDIDLDRPRNRLELADDPHYNHLRHEVLRFLYEKNLKVEDIFSNTKKANASAKKNLADAKTLFSKAG